MMILIVSVITSAVFCSGFALTVRIYGELEVRLTSLEGPIITSMEVSGIKSVREANNGDDTGNPFLSVIAKE